MAIVLNGIKNVGDFYSPHYMDALLEGDLKGLYSSWAEAEQEKKRTPPKGLAALERLFFDTKARVRRTVRVEDRYREARELHRSVLEALGYELAPCIVEIASTVTKKPASVPLLCQLQRDGAAHLWALEVPFPDLRPVQAPAATVDETFEETIDEDATDLWKQCLVQAQLPAGQDVADGLPYLAREPLEDLPARLFALEEPPRWLLMLAGQHLVLADRTKWAQGKYLLFDLDDLLGSKDTATLKAAAALLSRDGLCPEGGVVLHDTLDENSHKHAYAVSEDLKYGVRRAVELLANEYVWFQRNRAKKKLFFDQDDHDVAVAEGERMSRELTRECLRYLYRLLFLFYAEARGGELGVVPMESEEYRLGYSLESLRDLEQVPLTDPAALDGHFLHHSLERLFAIVNRGYGEAQLDIDYSRKGKAIDRGFSVDGLHSPLFDPAATPMLSSVKLRNQVLQQIIELLSLSREKKTKGKKSKKQTRGRISYAQLGINQLGAVYEGLLSYSGFFAREPLYEVAPAGADPDDGKTQTYFVPESELSRYKPEEIVVDEDPDTGEVRRRRFDKGSFIFRLAGRDRQKSASYYTPEVLTRCLVKYSLKELLKDKTADEILHLTVCEPAMGSGAFLNEAINQLAVAYLKRKQGEIGEQIQPAQFQDELQRVKAHMATHNCYGVDLNPTAVELARVSLWLNTIYRGSQTPWFGPRMATGNSLVGCRRAVYTKSQVMAGKWWEHESKAVSFAEERPVGTIYHFLLPDGGMAPFDKDKVVKGFCPDEIAAIKAWRKEATKKVSRADADLLACLSDAVDRLWTAHTEERRLLLDRTTQPIPVWGQPPSEGGKPMSIAERESLAAHLLRPHTAHARLRLVMDYWCAQWFWPIRQASNLPTRDELLMDLQMVLDGTVTSTSTPAEGEQMDLFALPEGDREVVAALYEDLGYVDTEELCRTLPRLGTVQQVRDRLPYLHWELEFAEVFAARGGFDLIVGNPPWVKVSWEEGGVLSDINPALGLRKLSAKKKADLRVDALSDPHQLDLYFAEFEERSGIKATCSAAQLFPLLCGVQTNLYKCFITRGWDLGNASAVQGLFHATGLFDDPKGGELREAMYRRLALLARFQNKMMLFKEILHTRFYMFSVGYCRSRQFVNFRSMCNLFHPQTVSRSIVHDGGGEVPGIRDEDGGWELRGHRNRVVKINDERLTLFASLYDKEGTLALHARLPVMHSEEEVRVLQKFAGQPRRLADMDGDWFGTVMFDETYSQRDGILKRDTRYPENIGELVLSGPHFYVATPLYKNPNEGCKTHLDYSTIDLTQIPEDYLPRTNYLPACSSGEYQSHVPRWNGRPVTEFIRHVNRKMIATTGERTLITCIMPPGPAHILAVASLVFSEEKDTLIMAGLTASLPVDFLIRSTGKSDLLPNGLSIIPFPTNRNIVEMVLPRVLELNCLTSHYRTVWHDNWVDVYGQDACTKADCRIPSRTKKSRAWSQKNAARSFFHRRQLLVELDALVAVALGITEDELVTLYTTLFPVLRQNERGTWYDQQGNIAFTVNRGLPGVGLERKDFELWQDCLQSNCDLPGDFDDMGLQPPFDRCSREADMRQAYCEFQRRISAREAL